MAAFRLFPISGQSRNALNRGKGTHVSIDKTAIRNAATVIVLRNPHETPSVLMGQRGANAAFMPNKFVFPGGAVDRGDADIDLAHPISSPCATRLMDESDGTAADTLCAAAIRELWEETGQIIGVPAPWQAPNDDWTAYANTGHRPSAQHLQFVFRAITPPGRPRRFDARFFLIDATHLQSDPDDFSAASEELSHLQWVPLSDARGYDLPFITEVVLAEIARNLKDTAAPASVPFFKNDDEESLFLRLRGHAPGADA